MKSPKPHIHQACIDHLEARMERLQASIAHAQQAASDDTKSSAGDKFETSREMMKLEIDKYSAQLSQASKMLQHLQSLKPEHVMTKVAFGSLVKTNKGLFYFSVSLGKMQAGDHGFFALSMAAPMGQALAGKKAGDKVDFMKGVVVVKEVW